MSGQRGEDGWDIAPTELCVRLSPESVTYLEWMRTTEEGVGMIRDGFNPVLLDVYDAWKEAQR